MGQLDRKRIDTKARAEDYLARASDLYIGRYRRGKFVDIDLRGAMVKVKRALLLDPENYDALALMGTILKELNVSDEVPLQAIEFYDRAIRIDPLNPEAYSSKADAFSDAGKYQRALASARKAWRLTLQDKSADDFSIGVACVSVRDILVKLKKWKEAGRVLREGLRRIRGEDRRWLQRMLDLTTRRIEWEPPPPDKTSAPRLRRVK